MTVMRKLWLALLAFVAGGMVVNPPGSRAAATEAQHPRAAGLCLLLYRT
jgi:hypothetical protein